MTERTQDSGHRCACEAPGSSSVLDCGSPVSHVPPPLQYPRSGSGIRATSTWVHPTHRTQGTVKGPPEGGDELQRREQREQVLSGQRAEE